MDFIVVCPHCGADIAVDRHNFFDVDYCHGTGDRFWAYGTLWCTSCDKTFSMDIELEPTFYQIRGEIKQ